MVGEEGEEGEEGEKEGGLLVVKEVGLDAPDDAAAAAASNSSSSALLRAVARLVCCFNILCSMLVVSRSPFHSFISAKFTTDRLAKWSGSAGRSGFDIVGCVDGGRKPVE